MAWDLYLDAASKIPPGETRSFLELAAMAGRPGAARAAGRALSRLGPRSRVPWHRIVSADGSCVKDPRRAREQLRRLRREGARPKKGESLQQWSRRVGSPWVGHYRKRRYLAADDQRVRSWSPQAVEPFRSKAAARARGFVSADQPAVAPFFLPRKSRQPSTGVRPAGRLEDRIESIDWGEAARKLMFDGLFVARSLLSSSECGRVLNDAANHDRFERSVNMAPRGFGVGTYHYFREPLAEPVETLRRLLYLRLQPIANEVRSASTGVYPASLQSFWRECREVGQQRSSSILLCYHTGGINHLHRDIYGKRFFPFQALLVLNRRGRDFEGGDFVLVDEGGGGRRSVVSASEGDLVMFASRQRWPERGGRRKGLPLRHGMERITRGERYALGIVFHLAE